MPVVVEGIVGLRKALRNYGDVLLKEFDDQVKAELKPIVNDAKAKVPNYAPGGLYNWNDTGKERKSRTGRKRAFPAYNAAIIKKGLTYSLAKNRQDQTGFVSMFTLFNRSAAGAIIETAGRANPNGSFRSESNNPNAGQKFIGAMNGIGALKDYKGQGQKTTGRLLFAAYWRNQGKALNAIMKAIEIANVKTGREIDKSKKLVA
jgi:hypothetical protein